MLVMLGNIMFVHYNTKIFNIQYIPTQPSSTLLNYKYS